VKILLLAPMLPQANAPGAIPMVLHAQIQALADRHELTFVAGVGEEPWEASAARELIATGIDAHLVDRRRPHGARPRLRRRLRLASDWARTGRPWRTLWFAAPAIQPALDDLARARTFDLVVVEDSSMAIFSLPPGVPAVLTEHEVGRPRPPIWHPTGGTALREWVFDELDWRRWESFQRAAWRRFDRVQTFSDYDARAIAQLAPDVSSRVRVNPFGLALPAQVHPEREQPGTVLFSGNFTHPPNRDAAAWLVREIMPRVRALSPQARLWLVGSAPTQEVLNLAGPGVEVIADVPDIDPYLEAAAVCVAPVRLGGGMRAKVLYALASAKAVVTTTRGAEGYAQPGRQLPMVVSDDAEGIAVAIAGLLQDASRRRELGRGARAFAEEFHSARAWGARLDAVYEEARSTGQTRPPANSSSSRPADAPGYDRRMMERGSPPTTRVRYERAVAGRRSPVEARGGILTSARFGMAVTLLSAAVLIALEAALLAPGRALAADIAFAVLVFVLLNAAAIALRGPPEAQVAGWALEALALVALARVVAFGLPLRDGSPMAGVLVVAVLIGVTAAWAAPGLCVPLRELLRFRSWAIQVGTAAAGLALGLAAYALGASALWVRGAPNGRIVVALIAVGVVSLTEELLFRGVVQSTLHRSAGRVGVLAASALFTATYLGLSSAALVMAVALAGLIFAYAVARTGSLTGALGGHLLLALGAGAFWPVLLGRRHHVWVHATDLTVALGVGLAAVTVLILRTSRSIPGAPR
jgi:glycosyltransferase involved in cell wall biosynthesis/membrane protease YdiL (CAAX protease family)